MTELQQIPANTNVDSIEEYLKNKYKFLNEKSPYSQEDFLQKPEEKNIKINNIPKIIDQLSPIHEPKKNNEDTMADITIFRDLQRVSNDHDNLLKKYENNNKDQDQSFYLSQKPQPINQNNLTSDPKLNKLLSDVENIVQKATGKALNIDSSSSVSDGKMLLGQNILGLSNKRNGDIENQEIRAYLKNLDNKLNIIAPKKEKSEKENVKSREISNQMKTIFNKIDKLSSSGSDEENSPVFKTPVMKQQPKIANFNNRNSVVSRENIKNERGGSQLRSHRSNSRHIFEKSAHEDLKIKELEDFDECLSKKNLFKKNLMELENNVFCVNCEQFVMESKIDDHSKVCHKPPTNHRLPSCDNKYNSMRSASHHEMNENITNSNQKKVSKVAEIKQINEQLNKLNGLLYQKLKSIEAVLYDYCDPALSQQTLMMLSCFFEQTTNLIHNRDVNVIGQISKQLYEIFLNLTEINIIPTDVLQLLQKIKEHCKNKYEALEPSKSYYDVLITNKSNYSLISTQRVQNSNPLNLTSFISDNISIAGNSRNKIFDSKKPPSDTSNSSEPWNSKALKKKFFNIAIKMKLCLPKGHQGNQVNLSDLFLECMQMKLGENEWHDFIQNKLNIYL